MDIEKIARSMELSVSDEDKEFLVDIEKKVFNALGFGFNPEVLEILNDEKASPGEIESIKSRLQQNVAMRLYGIANSVYYGKLRRGKISSFLEVFMRLGADHTKTYIIILTLLELARGVRARSLLAKSLATSVMARILADRFGFSDNGINKAELAGLLLEIGKMMVLIYEEKEKKDGFRDDFTGRFNTYLGLKAIKHFNLPAYLNEILLEDTFVFEEESISVSSAVSLSHLLVSHSFQAKGKLSLKVSSPDLDGAGTGSYGEIILDRFRAIDLDEYVEIIGATSEG